MAHLSRSALENERFGISTFAAIYCIVRTGDGEKGLEPLLVYCSCAEYVELQTCCYVEETKNHETLSFRLASMRMRHIYCVDTLQILNDWSCLEYEGLDGDGV